MKQRYFKRSANHTLAGLAAGYSDNYVNNLFARGYEEITEKRYNEYMRKDLAVCYDFETLYEAKGE